MKISKWWRLHFCSREPRRDGTLSIVKAECFGVICEKVDEAIDNDVAWSRGGIMSIAFHDDVFSSLHFGFTTRAAGGELGEESLSVFSNGGMTSSHAGEVSA